MWASLLAVFVVFASAATAYAECAWVLWAEQNEGPQAASNWRIIRADKTAADCGQELQSNFKQAVQGIPQDVEKDGRKLTISPSTAALFIRRSDGVVTYYLHLYSRPDTVDPRLKGR